MLLSYSEGLGLVFWEAMYMRVPVIGSPVGGIKETIGENGERGLFWDESYGVEDIAKKIKIVFDEGPGISEMKRRAHLYVSEKIKQRLSINDILK